MKCGKQPKRACVERRRFFRFGNEGPGTLFRLQDADSRQRSNPGTKRRTAHPEKLGKIALGRQTIAGGQITVLDHLAQTRHDFFGRRTVFFGFEIAENIRP